MVGLRWTKSRKLLQSSKDVDIVMPGFSNGRAAQSAQRDSAKCVGFIDYLRDGQLVGWALDPVQEKAIVCISIDGVKVGVIVCQERRDDVLKAGFPKNAYGFRFDVPANYFDGTRHEAVASFLNGDPLQVTTDLGIKHSLQFRSSFTPEFAGHCDGVRGDVVFGWVVSWNQAGGRKNGSNKVAIYSDGLLVGQTIAKDSRPDVGEAIGSESACGFSFQLPANRLHLGAIVEVVTFPHRWSLPGSPLRVERIPADERFRLSKLETELGHIAANLWRLKREMSAVVVPEFKMLSNYTSWTESYFPALARRAPQMAEKENLLVSVLCPVYRPRLKDFAAAVNSVVTQTYPHWELIIVDDASGQDDLYSLIDQLSVRDNRIKVFKHEKNKGISDATNSAIQAARGDLIAFFDHDDLLVPCALDFMIEVFSERNAAVAYSDEDKIDDRDTLSEPNLKPDWNLRFMLSQNYVCHLLVARREHVLAAGPFSAKYNGAQDHDFILRLSEVVPHDRIMHVPEILYHWRKTPNSTAETVSNKTYAIDAGVAAVSDYLIRQSRPSHVSSRGAMTNYIVEWVLRSEPSVSIIVPFKDKVEITRRCVHMLRQNTHYSNFEIVLVNNFSISSEADAFIIEASKLDGVRIIDVEESFNYSRINNIAVETCSSELVLFLNNDVFVSDPAWLTQLVGELGWRDDVGAVGCRLLYEKGNVQHAGVILGVGDGKIADHPFRGLEPDDPGFMGRALCSQEYSAVTAACLLTRRQLFSSVGGFDEKNLTVAYNDVDICLKIRQAGYRIIWRAETTHEHHESASRPNDMADHQLSRFVSEHVAMQERWGNYLSRDPYYNYKFSRDWGIFTALGISPQEL